MDLRETEATATRLCLQPEADARRLEVLGDGRIWGLYREMVRKRLLGELQAALRRTARAAGDAAFERAFEQHLREQPPRSRFFHGIVGDFADFAVPHFRRQPGLPPHVADLCAYEAAVWAVGDLDDRLEGEAPGEFSFDGRPVVSPATRLLSVSHAVHRKPDDHGGYAAGEHFLCIHRRPEETRARTWTMNAVTHDLMRRFADTDETVTEAVQQVAAARGIGVDEAFLERLCAVLADFIDRGIILGCR
ncbi:MAG: putative DNA-binding domain-containing protein [Myxococcales bacterium]|jgi:hypothetical protein